MGTAMRENQSLPSIFKGRQERSGDVKMQRPLPVRPPYLRANRFQGRNGLLKRKENSSQGSCRRLEVQLRRRKSIHHMVEEY